MDSGNEKPRHQIEIAGSRIGLYLADCPSGSRALILEANGRRTGLSLDALLHNEKLLQRSAQRLIGKPISSSSKKLKDATELAPIDPDALAIKSAGFERPAKAGRFQPRYYAMPNGQIISPFNEIRDGAIPLFEVSPGMGPSGDLATYCSRLAPLLRDQPIPLFIFFTSLAAILKPFCGQAGHYVENYLVELAGKSSSGKSTLAAHLAGSVWGGGNGKLGSGKSWNATNNSLEDIASKFNDRLLTLDEATASGNTAKERAAVILNVIHRLSLGETKSRFNGGETKIFETVVISTSNETLSSILEESESVRQAVEVRLLTFKLAKRPTGFFKSLPAGCKSVVTARKRITKICSKEFGTLAPALIERLLAYVTKKPGSFEKFLSKEFRHFFKVAKINTASEIDIRRAKPFALAYAAGKTAIGFKLLNENAWGDILGTIAEAWQELNACSQWIERMPADEAFDEYVKSNTGRFKKIDDDGQKPTLTEVELHIPAGYVITINGRQKIALTSTVVARAFPNRPSFVEDMKKAGRLYRTKDGNRTKKRIRKGVDGTAIYESFYVFDVTEDQVKRALQTS